MKFLVLVFLSAVCLQGLLAAPRSSGDVGSGPLNPKQKSWLETELKNLKGKGQEFKDAMAKYIAAEPALGPMIDTLLAKGQKLAGDFEQFKAQQSGLSAGDVDTKYRDFFKSLKSLEDQFLKSFKARVGPTGPKN